MDNIRINIRNNPAVFYLYGVRPQIQQTIDNITNTSRNIRRDQLLKKIGKIIEILEKLKNGNRVTNYNINSLRNQYNMLEKSHTNNKYKYKKYVSEITKIAKNIQNMNVNTNPKYFSVDLKYKNTGAYVSSSTNGNVVHIKHGHTRQNLRSRHIGRQLRAIVTLAAKRAGYKKVKQTSVFTHRNTVPTLIETKRGNTKFRYPPSSYVMKSLGFNTLKTGNDHDGHYYKHEYNFSKKPNNRRLLNALVISHPITDLKKTSRRVVFRRT